MAELVLVDVKRTISNLMRDIDIRAFHGGFTQTRFDFLGPTATSIILSHRHHNIGGAWLLL